MSEPSSKGNGGRVRAEKLTPEERRLISQKGVEAKRELAALPAVTHGSQEHPLVIGAARIGCFVLDNNTRVLTQRTLQTSIGMSEGGGTKPGEQRLVSFLLSMAEKFKADNDLAARGTELSARCVGVAERLRNPIRFKMPEGGVGFGFEATILADLCDLILEARNAKLLQKQQANIAAQAELLVRGFARVGIIALVDEATGYEKDKAKNDLARILQAFVAKELQPYLRTFPADYYEQLSRLYDLPYPPLGNKSFRPAFFGMITNDVIYSRLAPGLLPELKKAASKAEKKAKLHQWLTHEIGHPKLREHLASVVSILKLSRSPDDFKSNMNTVHPKYGDTKQLDFNKPD